jgi:hypothetical protein
MVRNDCLSRYCDFHLVIQYVTPTNLPHSRCEIVELEIPATSSLSVSLEWLVSAR